MKKRRTYKSIISINPYSKTFYEGRDNKIRKLTQLKYSRSSYYVSFLNAKNFIVSQINISKNIPHEDLKDAIELKAYEDLGLDQTIEYKIEYLEIPSLPTDKDRKFNVFVADPSVIIEDFQDIVSQSRYIDHIYPAPLLMKYLYTNEIVEDVGVHCYIYFQQNDAFLTIYKDGQYIYSKSLKYSFDDMSERFSEIIGERVDEADFTKMLAEEGLKTSNIDYQQYLMKLFGEIFLHINDVLIYAKRSNEIEKIDKVFIGSEYGSILGIDEYSQTYLGLSSLEMDFNFGFETDERYIEPLHYMLQLAAMKSFEAEEEEEICNFTLFKRPPPITQRPSGYLIGVTAASMLIAFAYPLYNTGYNLLLQFDIKSLKKEYTQIHAEKTALEQKINSLKKEKQNIKTKIAKEEEEYKKRLSILEAIYEKKVNYPMKAKILTELSQDLNRFRVKITEVENKENSFALNVLATDEKRITNLIKHISNKKGERFKVSTEEIKKDEKKENRYISTIKVDIK
ncbi:hypothetical protein [Nitrosophilus alvini]|uniref:hypothetical protein n=1 Tax=Nitrosophilus alvini TaxID=2714855 RepID=UPI00190CF0A9|nr:hypothetical protein [Nitrosophilus alvini]